MSTEKISPIRYAIAISKLWGNNFPVDVRQVAFEFTANKRDPITKIEASPPELTAIEGILAKKKTKNEWVIAYSTHIRESGKINFTIGHELGHYLCHRDGHDKIICTLDDLNNFPYKDEAVINMEQEANAFAAYLLMPVKDFRTQLTGQQINIDLMRDCAQRYDTTLTATSLQITRFVDRPVTIVVSQNGMVKWSRSSDRAFRNGLFYRKGTTLPDRSQSLKCATGGIQSNDSKGTVFDEPVWNQTGWVRESVIAQPYYESVFTLLEFEPHGGKINTEDELNDVTDAFDYFDSSSKKT